MVVGLYPTFAVLSALDSLENELNAAVHERETHPLPIRICVINSVPFDRHGNIVERAIRNPTLPFHKSLQWCIRKILLTPKKSLTP